MCTVQQCRGSSASYDANLLTRVETLLKTHLQLSARTFATRSEAMMERLLARLTQSMQKNVERLMLALHNVMVPTSALILLSLSPDGPPPPPPMFATQPEPDLEDGILRRLTHPGLVNWQVRAPLV
ncbi:hypothetical protein LTR66_011370, partial [Elasticomyces elasticus]